MRVYKRKVPMFLSVIIVMIILAVLAVVLIPAWKNGNTEKDLSDTDPDSREISSDADEPTSSAGDDTTSDADEQTSSDGRETSSDAASSDGKETSSDAASSNGRETESDAEEIEYIEGDVSYFWRRVPKTTLDKDNPFLLLVNGTHAIPDGYVESITLANVSGKYKLDERIADAMKALIAAAKEDGITITLCSAFRTNERQIELYTARIATEQKRDSSLSFYDACLKAARTNALPGTSEHETGLCWDFADLNESFEGTKEFAWLQKHAAEYGFILRYPKDKQDITGIIYEPWHYRYVGVETAKEMNELGMCLEEYVEYFYNK